jgi:DNA polymerase IV
VTTGFCRDCLDDAPETGARCAQCGSPRLIRHREIDVLSLAHVDCDAFYATIEKRDDPSLADKPLIVGGGKRGVVTTACYLARTFGVRSAMPMFEARRLCPHATIIPPDMTKYARVAREVRSLMTDLTPLVEPVSIDEAFMDLSGTARVHGMSPAKSLARFARNVENAIGITVSVGLSANKFLAKIASDLDKPRGFAVLGAGEAKEFLAPKPVTLIFGVGRVTQDKLAKEGIRTIADLQRLGETDLMRRHGAEGQRLFRLANGIDDREIVPDRETKSISAETTFNEDIADLRRLEQKLWLLTERVSRRLKAQELSGSTVTLKLKSADFRIKTRARSLSDPTQLAEKIFAAGRDLLAHEIDGTRYRLIGIGVTALEGAELADPAGLLDAVTTRSAAAERALDLVRERFGRGAAMKGIAFDAGDDD